VHSRWPAALLVAMIGAAVGVAGESPPAARGDRVLAVEDSLRVYTAPETTKVVARRIPLTEIIRKAQQGERHKYDGITTMAFDRTIKLTMKAGGRKPETRCIETVSRAYYRSPDGWAEAPLRETRYILDAQGQRKPWDEKDKDDIEVSSDGDVSELTDLPPYLENTDKFDFKIVNRSMKPDQVLYEIAFEPKSDFDILPGGRLWLLTNGYQIVHEEYHLKNLPVPWLLKSVGLLTREWQQVEGHWVQKRITVRAELRSALGLGLVKIPGTVEAVIFYDRYRFDLPLEAALFERKSK
jgi:hypothetical protein